MSALTPEPGTNLYAGEYQSAIARAKKVLLAAGFAWSTSTGRYHPFANTKVTTPGVRVTRIGCSDAVAVHAYASGYGERESRRWTEALAIATLRDAGLPFDDRGWLECGPRARVKLAKLAVIDARVTP